MASVVTQRKMLPTPGDGNAVLLTQCVQHLTGCVCVCLVSERVCVEFIAIYFADTHALWLQLRKLGFFHTHKK